MLRAKRILSAVSTSLVLVLAACPGDPPPQDAGEPDPQPTAPADAGEPEAPADAGEPEAPVDAGEPEAPVDAGEPEAPVDAGEPDAPADGGVDDAGTPAEAGDCADYCSAIMSACTGDDAQYGSEAECLDYCSNVGGWEAGTVEDVDGNTVGCREYHTSVAATTDPATHCAHAGPSGGNACGSWCEVYCDVFDSTCSDDAEAYASEQACLTACAGFPDTGAANDVEYDTVQCRIYHGGAPAAADPATHCGHARAEATMFCVGQPTDFRFRDDAPTAYTVLDSVGMPAVSTALIADKDGYNLAAPDNTAYVGEILASLNALHGALDDDLTNLGLTPCIADNPPTAEVQCHNQEVAPGVTVASLIIPDHLSIDPSAPAGFPNGRRLADRVMDVTLAIILLDLGTHPANAFFAAGLNPATNDLGVEGAFLSTFPYLHAPHAPAP